MPQTCQIKKRETFKSLVGQLHHSVTFYFIVLSEPSQDYTHTKLSIDVSSPVTSSQETTTYINMFRIRNNIIRLLQNQSVSIEEALLESFYILLELYRQPAVTEALVDEYFSAASLQALKNAIDDVDLPVCDT